MPPPVPPSVNAGRMISGKRPILFRDGAGFIHVMRRAADRHIQADVDHQIFEDLPVFAALDGLGIGADHFDAVFFKGAAAEQGHGGVQRGLTAERRAAEPVCRSRPMRFISSISRAMIFSTHSGVIGSM